MVKQMTVGAPSSSSPLFPLREVALVNPQVFSPGISIILIRYGSRSLAGSEMNDINNWKSRDILHRSSHGRQKGLLLRALKKCGLLANPLVCLWVGSQGPLICQVLPVRRVPLVGQDPSVGQVLPVGPQVRS